MVNRLAQFPLATIGSVARTVSSGFCFCRAATALLRYNGLQAVSIHDFSPAKIEPITNRMN